MKKSVIFILAILILSGIASADHFRYATPTGAFTAITGLQMGPMPTPGDGGTTASIDEQIAGLRNEIQRLYEELDRNTAEYKTLQGVIQSMLDEDGNFKEDEYSNDDWTRIQHLINENRAARRAIAEQIGYMTTKMEELFALQRELSQPVYGPSSEPSLPPWRQPGWVPNDGELIYIVPGSDPPIYIPATEIKGSRPHSEPIPYDPDNPPTWEDVERTDPYSRFPAGEDTLEGDKGEDVLVGGGGGDVIDIGGIDAGKYELIVPIDMPIPPEFFPSEPTEAEIEAWTRAYNLMLRNIKNLVENMRMNGHSEAEIMAAIKQRVGQDGFNYDLASPWLPWDEYGLPDPTVEAPTQTPAGTDMMRGGSGFDVIPADIQQQVSSSVIGPILNAITTGFQAGLKSVSYLVLYGTNPYSQNIDGSQFTPYYQPGLRTTQIFPQGPVQATPVSSGVSTSILETTNNIGPYSKVYGPYSTASAQDEIYSTYYGGLPTYPEPRYPGIVPVEVTPTPIVETPASPSLTAGGAPEGVPTSPAYGGGGYSSGGFGPTGGAVYGTTLYWE